MTTPDFVPYPDEYAKMTLAIERLSNAFDFSHLTETNKAVLEMAAHEEFAKIGIVIQVNWQEIMDAQTHRSTGVWIPGIQPIDRTSKESETDHDRIKFGVVRGLDGGQPGYLRADGTVHEDPIKKTIT